METTREYLDFCEKLVIEEVAKMLKVEFNFDEEPIFESKEECNHSTTYFYHTRDDRKCYYTIQNNCFMNIANKSPKARARLRD